MNVVEKYFNPTVHQSKNGVPVFKIDGGYKLKTDWNHHAVDRQGRKYSSNLHGDITLDMEGYLVELDVGVEVVSQNALQRAVGNEDKIDFNESIHEQTENNDPLREESGAIRLKEDWKNFAVDKQGRMFNEKIHLKGYELDGEGYLKVKRRGASIPISSTNRSQALVNQHYEEGYHYYLMNNESGRMEQFIQNNYEVVMAGAGQVTMDVGQARGPRTQAILMRKPIEWHNEDQNKKRDLIAQNYKSSTAPQEGQYKPDNTRPDTPLR